jgi:hypothetical protein
MSVKGERHHNQSNLPVTTRDECGNKRVKTLLEDPEVSVERVNTIIPKVPSQ